MTRTEWIALGANGACIAAAIVLAALLFVGGQQRYEPLQYRTGSPFRFDVVTGVYEAWTPEQGWIVVTPNTVGD